MPKNNISGDAYRAEDVALRRQFSGAANVLYHSYNSILLRSLIKSKRARLDKKIRHNMQQNRVYAGDVSYFTLKIISLRALLLLSTLLFKVATKLRSAGGRA